MRTGRSRIDHKPSSEVIHVSAPMFVQSTLESVQGGCHDNVLWKLIPDVYNAVAEAVCPNIQP